MMMKPEEPPQEVASLDTTATRSDPRETFDDEASYVTSTAGDDEENMVKKQGADKKEEVIASKENRHVFISRLAVFGVLVVSALCISLAVYFYLAKAEQEEFVSQFKSDAAKVMESVGEVLDQTMGSADAFAVKVIAYARYSNSTWPLVTLPNYAIQATKLMRLSKSFLVRIMPVVYPEQRDAWEEYAFAHNKEWIENGLDVQEKDPDYHGPISRVYATSYNITGFDDVPKLEPEPEYNAYLPAWQRAPILPGSNRSVYNYDGLTAKYAAIARWRSKTSKQGVISGFTVNHHAWVKTHLAPDEDEHQPISAFAYPMIDSLDTVYFGPNVEQDDSKPVVALLSINFRWIELIRNILPEKSVGIVLVFHQADCGEPFTYMLNGPEAIFLGMGDLHDPRFESLGSDASLADLMGVMVSSTAGAAASSDNPSKPSTYTGLPLDDEYCRKTISVYPSATMEDSFKTANPVILALVAAFIFIFTSFVFVMYDVLVARRQRVVMQRAVASGAIVSSLFPEKVKKQLYEEQQQEQQLQAKQNKFLASSFAGGGGSTGRLVDSPESNDAVIADHYKATTIILADLAGFTAWSATRTPAKVFELLETIYGAFDEIAARRNVFKIETIGDCYVAVTGIPDPQKDHAVRMVRFARACINEMSRITTSLAEQFGEDTEMLQLRIGLNSGPTTAGVLRGAKARFQLFGDTINTASRMESHGEPGRIHISESTAQELRAVGKHHWLTPREDKIEAKGKGELQTYWVTVRGGASSFTATTAGARSTAAASVVTHEDGEIIRSELSSRHLDQLSEEDEDEDLEQRLFLRLEV